MGAGGAGAVGAGAAAAAGAPAPAPAARCWFRAAMAADLLAAAHAEHVTSGPLRVHPAGVDFPVTFKDDPLQTVLVSQVHSYTCGPR